MHYPADTFALYEGLFKEAHDALTKEGRVGRIRQALGRLFDPSVEAGWARASEAEGILNPVKEQLAAANWENATNLRRIENLAKEVQTLGARPGALTEAEQAAARARQVRNIALGAGGVGLGVGVPAAYLVGHGQGSADKTRTRNIAFGAGTAAGLAAPHLIRGLGSIARGASQTGVFPELAGMGEGGYY